MNVQRRQARDDQLMQSNFAALLCAFLAAAAVAQPAWASSGLLTVESSSCK
jgi:hypothetical protein